MMILEIGCNGMADSCVDYTLVSRDFMNKSEKTIFDIGVILGGIQAELVAINTRLEKLEQSQSQIPQIDYSLIEGANEEFQKFSESMKETLTQMGLVADFLPNDLGLDGSLMPAKDELND